MAAGSGKYRKVASTDGRDRAGRRRALCLLAGLRPGKVASWAQISVYVRCTGRQSTCGSLRGQHADMWAKGQYASMSSRRAGEKAAYGQQKYNLSVARHQGVPGREFGEVTERHLVL